MNTVKEIETSAKQRMEKALEDLQHAMAAIRTGRASVHLLDNVRVDYYGAMTPINQLANIAAPEAKTLEIKAWDKAAMQAIEKAEEANLSSPFLTNPKLSAFIKPDPNGTLLYLENIE